MPGTYSFLDTFAAITGPGGAFDLSTGTAEEGISYTMAEEKVTSVQGADGSIMHSLHAGQMGTVTVRYLKTTPTNSLLNAMYDLQRTSSALTGQNTLVIRNPSTGDVITCTQMAFVKQPDNTYAKDGGVLEWQFRGRIEPFLGAT